MILQARYLDDYGRDVMFEDVLPVAVGDDAQLIVRPGGRIAVDMAVKKYLVFQHAYARPGRPDANPKYGHGC